SGYGTIGIAKQALAAAMPANNRSVKPSESPGVYGIFMRFEWLLISVEVLSAVYSFFHPALYSTTLRRGF
ncbi:MAG TPA: hypothetical protein VLT36_10775, partial [Candidatus Dormibacteraeota bacterium]|nr:hypothetical protein [Candidatus Dormibacteraeota bacterium]